MYQNITSLITSSLVLLLSATSMAEVRNDPSGTKSPDPAIEAMTEATHNLEKYRAEVGALIRGAPSLKDSQRLLTGPHSLPGDPLAGMTPPAGPHAPRAADTLMVFLTLSMPDAALAGWLEETARAGGVAVIRGFHGDRLSTTLKRLAALQELVPSMKDPDKNGGGVSVDPAAFTRFGIDVAPVVVVLAAPLPPCNTSGCIGDPAPPHDRIAGNITLSHALRRLADGGDVASATAALHLTRLEKGHP